MNYPIRATVYVPQSASLQKLTIQPGQHRIERMGGGARTLAEAGADYYPTRLWAFPSRSGGIAYFDPSQIEGLRTVSIDEYHDSDADPMSAATGWPLPQ